MTYKLVYDSDYIIRLFDGAWIPPVTGNADYRTFLEWKEKGNVPEPADSPLPEVKRFSLSSLTDIEVAELKALLVQNGVITQQRADEL